MFEIFEQGCLLAFQVTTQPGTAPAATGGADPNATGGLSSMLIFMPLMVLMMLVFMSLTSKPQQKEQQRVKQLLENLKKNDKVVTAGGIVGSVVNVNSDAEYVTLRIDETNNTKMQVLKQSIVRILKDPATSGEENKKS